MTGSNFNPDSIEALLSEPPVSSSDLKLAGGPLLHWERALPTRSRLARMALDFLSAPGESRNLHFTYLI